MARIFGIYKTGQGKYTRMCSALGFGLIVAIGCYRLYDTLRMVDTGLNQRTELWINTMVPAVLFAILAFLIFKLINKPTIADFMIAGEGEMKKVSWSSRKEIVASTVIVIIVVILMAVLLGLADLLFRMFFNWLLIDSQV
ncbi:MAG: preprotein translocase subunit SecE [Planctomycetota bacterium]|jgi:preprotein translocase subunit SecE